MTIAVLTRAESETPRSSGLQMATAGYVDTQRRRTLVPETSTATVARRLPDGGAID